MSNKETQLPVERFSRGDCVTNEDIIILVTGWGHSEDHFCGVVIETKPDAQFPKRLGEYSSTWYTRYFKKIEYATKLHEAQRENDELKRWKLEAIEFQIPIISYAHKHLEVCLSDSCSKLVVSELDRLRVENEKMKALASGWRPLLEEVLSKHESGLLPDRFVYDKIKRFLYG